MIEIPEWDLFYYALSFGVLNKFLDAIEVGKQFKNRGYANKVLDSFLVKWTSIEYFSRKNNVLYKENHKKDQFEYIYDNIELTQLDERAVESYKYMLLKVCKELLVMPSKSDAETVVKYLKNIDLSLFSTTPREFTDEYEKKYTYYSEREAVKTHLIKALWFLNDYQECSRECYETLQMFEKLHHKLDMWFEFKKLVCDIKIRMNSNVDSTSEINKLTEMAEGVNHFAIYKALADLHKSNGDYGKSLAVYSQAFLCNYKPKELFYKSSVIKEMAIICENLDNKILAKDLYSLMIKLRKENNYDENQWIKSKKSQYGIDDGSIINYGQILDFCVKQIALLDGYYLGEITQFFSKEKGVLKTDAQKGKNINFFINSIRNPLPKINKSKNKLMIAFSIKNNNFYKVKNIFVSWGRG